MDRDYRITAKTQGFEGTAKDNLAKFPIEKARFRSVWYMVVLSAIAICGYGWSLQATTVCLYPRESVLMLTYGSVCSSPTCTTVYHRSCDHGDI